MDEDGSFLGAFPLMAHMQERVDRILLAVARRHAELRRDLMAPDQPMTQEPWQVEVLRRSPLGQQLLLIARYVEKSAFFLSTARVEQAMQHVLQMIFGDVFGSGYTVPSKFHTTELGKLFHDAYSRMYRYEDLMTVQQAYQEVGVARQSVYDRIADGKLHPIYFYGDQRLLRSEVEAWKVERQLRNKAKGE